MKLPFTVDSLDKIPEEHRSLYASDNNGKFVIQVEGAESSDAISGLRSALDKERTSARTARDELSALNERFKGIDPDKLRGIDLSQLSNIMKRFDTDEEARLIAEGKIDEVVSKRMERARAGMQSDIEAANAKVTAAEKRAAKFAQNVLDNHIRAAAAKVGLHQHAVDDALVRGGLVFSLDDDGNAVQRDANGNIVLGKDGKTPFTPNEWLDGMRATAPHWFPASGSGGGASGGGSQSAGGKTLTRAQFNELPATEKIEKARTHTITD